MLKKGDKMVQDDEALQEFSNIKGAIKEEPVLKIPNFKKPFQIFSFSLYHIVVMLQKSEKGHEQPIAFFSKSLKSSQLNYDINEKQAYALVKVVGMIP